MTPALVRGSDGALTVLREGELAPFHSRHRRLPLPCTAAFVASGPLPEVEGEFTFLTLGDAAELRSRGIEVAGRTVAIWRSEPSNMAFTAAMFDAFRAEAAGLPTTAVASPPSVVVRLTLL